MTEDKRQQQPDRSEETAATTINNSPSSTSASNNTEEPPELAPDDEAPQQQQQQQAYDPNRAIYIHQMEATMNLLIHPVWIYDFKQRKMRWGNQATLDLWMAPTMDEFLARDFSQMSEATFIRSTAIQATLEKGQRTPHDLWTFYPKGVAVVVRVSFSGIRLLDDDDPHVCFLVEAVPVQEQELNNDLLRGVEMLRHLPIAVCQFDMDGNCMFQNPAAKMAADVELAEDEEKKELEEARSMEKDDDPGGNGDQHKRDNSSDDHENGITTSVSRSNTNDTTTATITKTKRPGAKRKRKTADSGLLSRFADPKIGKKVLQQVKDEFPENPTPDSCIELEAMIQTQKGPVWSAIQIRLSTDPVTGQSVLLYNACDKSDAVYLREERRARAEKAEFFAIISHEIRTPLHQVTGFIDLLDQTQLDKEQKGFVGVLKSSSQGLMTVINDVLDYSKLEAGQMKLETIPYEPLSVTKGSLEAVRASCEERNLYLKLDWDTHIPFKLKNDPNRLRQILLNLLSNAVKFTKTGGITIKASYLQNGCDSGTADTSNGTATAHDNGIRCDGNPQSTTNTTTGTTKTTKKNQPMIKFAVTDTGIGISDEHKKVIFQKYQQANKTIARNYGGTGLGLSICHSLVEAMGGSLGVQSEEGKGTTFWFVLQTTLPTEKELAGEFDEEDITERIRASSPNASCIAQTENNPAPIMSNNDNKKDNKPFGLNILVAEDNKVNQKLVVKMLQQLGHSAAVAENGKQAIEMINRCVGHSSSDDGGSDKDNNQQQHRSFDICLMDIQMPVMDGLEATKRLRSMGFTNLPIFGLTASVGRSDFVELGFNDWLSKPIRLKDLKVKLGQLMKQLGDAEQNNQSIGEGPPCALGGGESSTAK